MRTLGVLALSISALITGCVPKPKPIMLRVDTLGLEPAHLRTNMVKGDKPTVPTQCATPCDIQIPPDTEQQMSIEAPGCYPAQFNINYVDVWRFTLNGPQKGAETVLLRVPLQHRPSANNINPQLN